MAKRGPKQQPSEIAARKGNPGHRPITPTPDAVAPIQNAPPQWLTGDKARLIWSEMITIVEPLRFVKSSDHNALARYCKYLAMWIDLATKIDTRGDVAYTTDTNHGTMERLHPHFQALMRVEGSIAQLETNLGLTPSARQSLLNRLAPGATAALTDAASGSGHPRAQSAGNSAQTPFGLLSGLHAASTSDDDDLPPSLAKPN